MKSTLRFALLMGLLLAWGLSLSSPTWAAPTKEPALDPTKIIQFPDPNFKKKLLLLELDLNEDGEIQVSEAQKVTRLDVGDCGLESLKGIKYFSNLDELGCYQNRLKTLDVEGMSKLRVLVCFSNELESLKVGNLPKLEHLDFSTNQLQAVDFSGSPNLMFLDAEKNALTNLDLRPFSKLNKVYLSQNRLSELHSSGLPSLEYLFATDNGLTHFEAKGLSSLKELHLNNNQLQGTQDLRECSKLETLALNNNPLTGLDIRGLGELKALGCYPTLIKSINFSGTTKLNSVSWLFEQ